MQKVNDVHDELHIWDNKILKQPMIQLKKMKKELKGSGEGP